jgi:Tfp pilus assembly protein PilO
MKTDFKNIELNDRNKIIIISAAFIILAFYICVNIVRANLRKKDFYSQMLSDEAKKVSLRMDIEKIDGIKSEYLNYFYDGINQQQLRSVIMDIAKESGVDIMSMKPLDHNDMGSISKESFEISLVCGYAQLGAFISSIENLDKFTAVESITVKALGYKKGGADFNPDLQQEGMYNGTNVEAEIVVAAYVIKG